jgi:hypothetical protein
MWLISHFVMTMSFWPSPLVRCERAGRRELGALEGRSRSLSPSLLKLVHCYGTFHINTSCSLDPLMLVDTAHGSKLLEFLRFTCLPLSSSNSLHSTQGLKHPGTLPVRGYINISLIDYIFAMQLPHCVSFSYILYRRKHQIKRECQEPSAGEFKMSIYGLASLFSSLIRLILNFLPLLPHHQCHPPAHHLHPHRLPPLSPLDPQESGDFKDRTWLQTPASIFKCKTCKRDAGSHRDSEKWWTVPTHKLAKQHSIYHSAPQSSSVVTSTNSLMKDL